MTEDSRLIEHIAQDYSIHQGQPDYEEYMNQLTNASLSAEGGTLMCCEGIFRLYGTSSKEFYEKGFQDCADKMHEIIAGKDAEIAEKDAEISEKDAEISEKDAGISEKMLKYLKKTLGFLKRCRNCPVKKAAVNTGVICIGNSLSYKNLYDTVGCKNLLAA